MHKPPPKLKLKLTSLLLILATLILEARGQVTTPEEKEFAGTFGVGVGVIIVIIAMGIGAVVCIYGRATPDPLKFAIFGTLIPILTFATIYYLPKEAQRPISTTAITDADWTLIRSWAFYVLIFFFTFTALIMLMIVYCCRRYRTYPLNTKSSNISFLDDLKPKKVKKYKRDRAKYIDKKPEIEARDIKKMSVRPSNWRRRKDQVEEAEKEEEEEQPRLRTKGGRRRGKRRQSPRTEERRPLDDRSIKKKPRRRDEGRSGKVLTKDGGEIDKGRGVQYERDEYRQPRNLDMNLSVEEEGSQDERELIMSDEEVFDRIVNVKRQNPQLDINFFLN